MKTFIRTIKSPSRRMPGMAGLLAVVFILGAGHAVADSDSVDDSARKVGQGFGELLKGMGQEVGKAIGSSDKAKKKEDKKSEESENDKSGKDKENHK